MTARTFIIGGTVREARAWCRENGVQPYASTTVIATHERALRGHTIRREDRVVWQDPISADLYEGVFIAKNPPPPACPKCGKPEGSFACRIRHIHMNTGDAKAARDIDGGSR